MLELTQEQCLELEQKVHHKLCGSIDDSGISRLYAVIMQAAIRATIITLREYEKLRDSPAVSQQ